jgi:hypothetical protein
MPNYSEWDRDLGVKRRQGKFKEEKFKGDERDCN